MSTLLANHMNCVELCNYMQAKPFTLCAYISYYDKSVAHLLQIVLCLPRAPVVYRIKKYQISILQEKSTKLPFASPQARWLSRPCAWVRKEKCYQTLDINGTAMFNNAVNYTQAKPFTLCAYISYYDKSVAIYPTSSWRPCLRDLIWLPRGHACFV